MSQAGNKIVKFFQRNVVLITGIGIIISTHWGWSQLQKNPNLVPEEKRKDLPIIIGFHHVQNKVMEYFNQPSKASDLKVGEQIKK